MAGDDFEGAADGYAQIGSLPDEAFARLRAAQRLLGGGQRAKGDTRYLREGKWPWPPTPPRLACQQPEKQQPG